jgi:hypothetical protein
MRQYLLHMLLQHKWQLLPDTRDSGSNGSSDISRLLLLLLLV